MPDMMIDDGQDCAFCQDPDYDHFADGSCSVSGCDCNNFEEPDEDDE